MDANKFDAKEIENKARSYLDSLNQDQQQYDNDNLSNLAYHANNNNTVTAENSLYSSVNLVGYIDGPPTMNGIPHVGHLRGRIIKDLWYRFQTLQGKKVIFRPGWDTQGLPVELQAEKELGLTGSKSENIDRVGITTIVETCKKIVHYYNEKWVDVDRLLGMSFNYNEAYWTFNDKYIEREWRYLRSAWDNGILKEWFRVVAFCPSCQTSLSNAEVNQGYENVEDPSFYYKVKLIDEDAYLLVWTTMPFTLVTDEMTGVNPDANYVYVKVKDETWIVGETRLDELMKELNVLDYVVIDTVKGSSLDKKYYRHPLLEYIPKLDELAKNKLIHFVVAEKFVDITTGSGIVHLSPANGEDDFDIAVKRDVPIFVPIDDRVIFTSEAGVFQGLFVRDADSKVLELMNKKNSSVKVGKIKHQYPTCWRSHHKLVWLARREYFYMIDKLGDKPFNAANNVEYFYDAPKNRFLEIIKEKVPWCISRERIWGTPLPIWACSSCSNKEIFSSRNEIISRAVKLPHGENFELHRPWIDEIEILCNKCNAVMNREPFVLDTWHNSGAAPYASQTDEEYNKLIPSLFLTEGIDQTRGWSYTLLMNNIILKNESLSPFKSFLFQGHVLDEKGNKMSKSAGNVIDAKSLLEQNSVDLIRFYFMWKTSPIESLNFDLKEMSGRPYQIMSTLYYTHIYLIQNSTFDKFDRHLFNLPWLLNNLKITEKWLLSELQNLISEVTVAYKNCKYHEVTRFIEDFIINQISQTYIPLTRNDLWNDSENVEDRNRRFEIYATLDFVLKQINILLHPVSPFITEHLYNQCFHDRKTILDESWPISDPTLIDLNLENDFEKLKQLISITNAARMKAQFKRRWPIHEILLYSNTNDDIFYNNDIYDILKNQINVEKITFIKSSFQQNNKVSNQNNTENNIFKIIRILHMIDNNLPIIPVLNLVRKKIAPKVKSDINIVIEKFNLLDKLNLMKKLSKENVFILNYLENKDVEITVDDIEIDYTVVDDYVVSEKDDFTVFLSTKRNDELIIKGLLRDLARNIQQFRKEMNFNPTDILDIAYISNLTDSEIVQITPFLEDLKFLIRVKTIQLNDKIIQDFSYKNIDIDGRNFHIFVK